MVSIILCSRAKNNIDSNLFKLLKSLEDCGGDENNSEVLIKFDDDDDTIPCKDDLDVFKYKIKTLTFSRGEGRFSLHNDYLTLFTEINQKSKYVINISDDFYFTRFGFIDEILSLKREHNIIGTNFVPTKKFENYRENFNWKNEVEFMTISRKTLEILGNFGYHSNTDNWIYLINVILQNKYNLDLTKKVDCFCVRDTQKDFEINSLIVNKLPHYNKLYVDGNVGVRNIIYFDLVEQQAKNIYLNILESGNIKDYTINFR